MFKTKVVFVLGAGTSKEAGFPLGSELKQQIAEGLNFYFGHSSEVLRGDVLIAEAIAARAHRLGEGRGAWHVASRQISASMPLALSIDNFLHAHQHDSRVVMTGKLAIARSILRAENNSPLRPNSEAPRVPNFRALQNTWYSKFFQLLTANVPLDEIRTIFQSVSVITFNYDRSLEQYLVFALQTYYSLSESDAAQLVRSLNIVHPYGTVGDLPWQGKEGVPFGGSDDAYELVMVAEQIRTFTETTVNAAVLKDVRGWLEAASTVVFLGFAFHEINMKLLQLAVPATSRKVYATAVGISPDDCAIVRAEIQQCLCTHSGTIEVVHGVDCANLFDRHWRAFNTL